MWSNVFLVTALVVASLGIVTIPSADAGCVVNAGWCSGNCTVNTQDCYGDCKVNAGTCNPGGTCIVNAGTCNGGTNSCSGQAEHKYGPLAFPPNGHTHTANGVVVWDTNLLADCDGNDVPGDFDGDFDHGIFGAFFPLGWDPDCQYGYDLHHGPGVTVSDSTFSAIAFVTAADQTFGPTKIPIDKDADGTPESYLCTTDGVIDGDDPTGNDCVSQTYVTPATGTACGEGGDGGFWVFLATAAVDESGGSVYVSDSATFGSIWAT